MDRYLVVIGCQKEKLAQIPKREANKILDFINANSHTYTGVISILRKRMDGDKNLVRSGDNVATDREDYLDYQTNSIIQVPGYDVDCTQFRKDVTYDIIGISTSASVLCIAMSMYSCGLNVRILKEYCEDRKGSRLEKHAFEIMNAYMPGVLI